MIKPLFQNILVMVNGTEASINAVRYAVLMAKLYRCKVFACYVVDTATIKQIMLSRVFIEEESAEYEHSLEENGKRYLAWVDEIGKSKGVKIECELRRGAVWSEIVSLAEARRVDAILLGASDSSGSDQKEIQSSTFRSILLNARCSVIAVKEAMIEQLYKLA